MFTYDQIPTLPVEGGAVLVDMAGSPELRRAVHEHVGAALLASIAVGATHWEGGSRWERASGPTPEFFFAPTRGEQRAAEIGPVGPAAHGAAWASFADRLPGLLEIESLTGAEALGQTYDALLDGNADPGKGYVFSL